ncbi:extracellular solute-binding protein [Paenibacillus eucommiae]|uniref:Aldouronate transport system substrate-binding protein n=1 Tax=Paenibacillus eucommiae TaxID=1355755 RepID=A0ABS4ISB2_9BACL|nr:extracellular solute-binding protein [Paenibacillus eucommiae]MBP1990469.1 putative aldouronate transport system substrate-binding protein [Paenibacillus eucommiae]
MGSVTAKRVMFSCLILLLLVAAACSRSGGDKQESSGSSQPAETTGSDNMLNPMDMNAKYDPPVTITTIRAKNESMFFHPDESMDHNAIYDAYLRDLGIIIKNDWVVDGKEYDQKLKISIASDNLPDFFLVSAADLPQLIESDMVMDLTEAYEQFASDKTKEVLMADGGKQMKTATFGGKLMAIPQTSSPFGTAELVWLRNDWLREMKLPEPKTMQDLLKISEAFASRDSGGKGKVFGMALNKEDISVPTGFFNGFFNGYHAYPTQWVKDEAGNLVYGSLQPEMKTALKQLQDLYKAGQLDPELAVNDSAKSMEMVANDRIGLMFGEFWMSAIMQQSVVKDNKVTQDWGVYLLPSIDEKPALTQVSASVNTFYVINKKAKNPDAVFKLLNHWVNLQTEGEIEEGNPRSVYTFGRELKSVGKEFWAINPLVVFLQDIFIQGGKEIPKAIQTGDASAITWSNDLLSRYEAVKKYDAGDTALWLHAKIAGEGGGFAGLYDYFTQDRYHFDEFYGPVTPVIAERGDLLKTKEQELFTKIIMGSVSIDEFDKFIGEWNKLGGDQITREVNDWYKSMN